MVLTEVGGIVTCPFASGVIQHPGPASHVEPVSATQRGRTLVVVAGVVGVVVGLAGVVGVAGLAGVVQVVVVGAAAPWQSGGQATLRRGWHRGARPPAWQR